MLTLRRNGRDDDYEILKDGKPIGLLYRLRHGPSVDGWFWSVIDPARKKPDVRYRGVEPTLNDAKACFVQALKTLPANSKNRRIVVWTQIPGVKQSG